MPLRTGARDAIRFTQLYAPENRQKPRHLNLRPCK
jgi:hypothetical protein